MNLLEYGTVVPGDVQNYFNCVHYQGKLRLITVNGSQSLSATYIEATLDVEMIAGLAPAANIVSYQVGLSSVQTYDDVWTRYNDALQRMIDDNTHNGASGSVVSISYGVTEGLITQGVIASIDQSLDD